MTVEPASTRANRINSDNLDWSYIGISFTFGHSTRTRRAGSDPRLVHRRPCTDRRRRPALRRPERLRLRGPRQCLGVDVLPDVRHLAASNDDGEDPVVLERLIRGFDLSRGGADD